MILVSLFCRLIKMLISPEDSLLTKLLLSLHSHLLQVHRQQQVVSKKKEAQNTPKSVLPKSNGYKPNLQTKNSNHLKKKESQMKMHKTKSGILGRILITTPAFPIAPRKRWLRAPNS